jgi:cell division protein FtsI/penicillin-binding protein 2
VVRQVISPETAKQMTDILVSVMEHGEAKGARVDGYRMAGKTGTAENPEGGHYGVYEPYDYFVGFAPAEDPVFVMLVKLDKPAGSPWASEVAAPLWRDIAIELCSLLNIPPDNVRLTNR